MLSGSFVSSPQLSLNFSAPEKEAPPEKEATPPRSSSSAPKALKIAETSEGFRWRVFDADTEEHVASIFDPGPGLAHWYTSTGAGRAWDRYDALTQINQHMGITPSEEQLPWETKTTTKKTTKTTSRRPK